MSTPIQDDLERCIDRLANIKAHVSGADYSDQRAAASQAKEAVTELIIEMAESLNWIADTGELSKTDRRNIRAYVHDGFIEAVDLADERANAVLVAAE
jgi:hypothetical protein